MRHGMEFLHDAPKFSGPEFEWTTTRRTYCTMHNLQTAAGFERQNKAAPQLFACRFDESFK